MTSGLQPGEVDMYLSESQGSSNLLWQSAGNIPALTHDKVFLGWSPLCALK